MKTELVNGFSVDTWWDQQARVWITQILDENEFQQGEALFSGNRTSAKFDHQLAIATALELEAE